jgi:hypothetical protein
MTEAVAAVEVAIRMGTRPLDPGSEYSIQARRH